MLEGSLRALELLRIDYLLEIGFSQNPSKRRLFGNYQSLR